jgi:iron(III) transport system permease protein
VKPLRARTWLWWAVIAPPLLLVAVPAATLVVSSFRDAPPGAAGSWTAHNYVAVLTSPRVWSVAGTTFWIALVATALALTAGFFMAWLVARTDIPGRRLLSVVAIVPFLAPSLVVAIGWAILGNPDNGIINGFYRTLAHGTGNIVDVYSYGGVALVMSFPAAGFIYLMMLGPLGNSDPSLEDSARLSGASPWYVFRTIQVPLLMPAFLPFAIIAFIRAIEAFEVPQILGTPAGIYVFINFIYDALKVQTPPHYGTAIALSTIVGTVALLIVAIAAQLQQARATVSGKGFQPRRVKLRKAKIPCLLAAWGYLALLLLPLGAIVLSSFWKFLGNYDPKLATLANYRFIATDPTTQRALLNTVALMFLASTVCVAVGALVSFALLRKIRFGRIAIDAVLLIPWAIPGLILGVALLWTYINIPGMYGTFWGVLLGFVTLGIPLAMRSTGAVLAQLGSELEEASAVHGAGAGTTLRRIVVPLIMPGLVAAWFTLATLFSRELSVAVMLYGFGSEVASVQLLSYWEQGEGTRVAALSVLLVAFVFLLYVVQQKVTRNVRIPEPQ